MKRFLLLLALIASLVVSAAAVATPSARGTIYVPVSRLGSCPITGTLFYRNVTSGGAWQSNPFNSSCSAVAPAPVYYTYTVYIWVPFGTGCGYLSAMDTRYASYQNFNWPIRINATNYSCGSRAEAIAANDAFSATLSG